MTQPLWIGTVQHLNLLGLSGIAIGTDGNCLSYGSQELAESDLADGSIGPFITHLMYDPEYEDTTPQIEQDSPALYGQYFGQAAQAHGLSSIWAPARNLVYPVTGSYQGTDEWYLSEMPYVASWNPVYLIQSEHDTPNLASYVELVSTAATRARTANPYVTCYAELATGFGTADEMVAAGKAVLSDVLGFYLSIPLRNGVQDPADIATMADVVSQLSQ